MRHNMIWPALAVMVLAAGCGGGSHRALREVAITERDFHITAPHVVPAGDVRIVLTNKGPVTHELIIVRATRARLPRRPDGFTIDEDALTPRIVGSFERDGPSTRDQVIHLTPGRYIIFCNMAGHAASGMLTSFRVR
jgi:uncharacterized cupredoxin-like copper-binding protein